MIHSMVTPKCLNVLRIGKVIIVAFVFLGGGKFNMFFEIIYYIQVFWISENPNSAKPKFTYRVAYIFSIIFFILFPQNVGKGRKIVSFFIDFNFRQLSLDNER